MAKNTSKRAEELLAKLLKAADELRGALGDAFELETLVKRDKKSPYPGFLANLRPLGPDASFVEDKDRLTLSNPGDPEKEAHVATTKIALGEAGIDLPADLPVRGGK